MAQPQRRWSSSPLALAIAVAAFAACSDRVGPGVSRAGSLGISPRYESAAAGVVDVAAVRVRMVSTFDDRIALDTVIAFPPGVDSVSLAFTVPLEQPGEEFQLFLRLIGPAGDTVFTSGPDLVRPASGGAPAPVVEPLLTYVGVGANAAAVVITSPDTTLFFGGAVVLGAMALDPSQAPIPGTPVEWISLDPLVVVVPDADSGRVIAGTQRGTARIVARLLTGQADTVRVVAQPVPGAIAPESGSGQTAPGGGLLPQPLVARVTAADGLGVRGVWVRFAVTAGGGALGADSARTDSTGRASVSFQLGQVGAQTVQATVASLSGQTATFAATVQAGPPRAIAIVAGNSQTAIAGSSVAVAPRVVVTDSAGRLVPGAPVIFSVTAGGGSVAGGAPLTGANGEAAVTGWTLGPVAGPNAVEAAVDTFRVTFTATGIAGPASQLQLVSGDAQSDTAAATLAQPLVVRATDANGNGAPGVPIAWTATAGTLGDDTVATDATGHAQVPWTLPTTVGTPGATARIAGTAVTRVFTATVLPAAARRLAFTVQPANVAQGAAIAPPVEVEVTDQFGNRRAADAGRTVVIAIGANPGGASLGGTPTASTVAGVAAFANLTVSAFGSGFTLVATSAGLVPATSTAFTVLSPPGQVLWTNPAGGSWSTGANWSSGTPPAATDTAHITLDGTYTVTLDVNPTIAGLVLGGGTGTRTLSGTGRALLVNGPVTVAAGGALTLTGGSLGGTGPLTNQGQVTLLDVPVGVAVANAGVLRVRGTTALNGALSNAAGGEIRVEAIGGADGNVTTAAGWTNAGTLVLTHGGGGGGQPATLTVNGTLVNAIGAVVRSEVGLGTFGARTLAATLDNRGLVDLQHELALSRASAAHVSSGTITVAGGNLTVTQSGTTPSLTSTGTITVGAGRTLAITGGAWNTGGSTLNGAGAVTLAGVAWALGAGYTVDSLVVSATGGSLGGTGPLTNQGQVTLLDVPVGVAVANAGVLRVRGTTALNGALSNAAGGEIRVEAIGGADGNVTTAAGWTNAGTLVLTHGGGGGGQPATLTVNGTLVNAIGAVVRSEVGLGTFGARTLAATLDNRGLVDLQHELALGRASAAHVSSGTISVAGGNLTVTQSGTTPSLTSTGTITVGAGRTLAVSGGTFASTGAGVIQGTGTLDVATTTFSNAGVVGPGLSPGVLTVTGNYPQTASGTLAIEVGGATPGTGHDRLVVSGAAALAGSLNVSLFGGFTPVLGQQFTVLTFASRTGDFTSVTLPPLSGGLDWQRTFSGTAMVLEVIPATATPGVNAWTAAASGLWSDATRWTRGRAPIPGDTVLITAVGTYTVTLDVDASVDSLVLGGASGTQTLDATGVRTLTLTGDATIGASGRIRLASGDLTVGGGNVLTLNGGAIQVGAGRSFGLGVGGDASELTYVAGAVGGPGWFYLNADAQLNLAANLTLDSLNVGVLDGAVNPVTSGRLIVGPGSYLKMVPTTGVNINTVLENRGIVDAVGPLNFVNDSVVNVAGATLRVEAGDPGYASTQLTVAGGLLNAGTVELVNSNAASAAPATLQVTGGGLRNLAAGTVRSAAGGGGGGRTLNAVLDNQGTVAVDYPLALARASAAHVNDGTVRLTGGSLTIAQSGTTPSFTNRDSIVVGAGRTLTVAGGTLVNTRTPTVGVLAGTGTIDVSAAAVANDGIVAPGLSPGLLAWTGAAPFSGLAGLAIEIGGTTAGTQYDRLAVNGAATLGGTLTVALTGGFTPVGGEQFTVLTFASRTGDFATVNVPALGVGLGWQRSFTATAMVLTVTNAFAGAPPGTDAVWTGAVSSSWTTAANWAPGVPGLTDDVFIRADAANPLVVTGVRTVDSLTVQTGAIVTVSGTADTLVVGGSLAAGSPAIGGTGAVRLTGANQRARGRVPTLVVTGTITASDSLRIAGNLLIGGTGRLNAGAFRVAVEGALTTTASGTLGMTGLDDRVDVAGSATFGGGDSFLTGGVLTVGGDFTQSGAGPRFRTTDAHRTRLTGAAGQTVGFADPLANGFGQLTVLTADSLHAASLLPAEDIVVADSLAAGGVVVRGTGYLVAKNPSGGNLVLRSDAGRPVRVRAAGLRLFGNVALVGADVGVQVSELEYWGDAPVTIPADPRVSFTRLTVRGTRIGSFASGQTYAFQDVIVTDDASLSVGSATVNLSGDLSTGVNGVLVMSAAGGAVNAGTASFGGGSTAGLLTAGTLRVHGDIDQAGDPESFAPSGAHLTVLDGGGGTLTFANPAPAGGSHFHHLSVLMSGTASNGGALVINGNLVIQDTAQFAPSGIVGGSGDRITVVGSATISQSRTAAVLTSDVLRFGGAVSRNGGAVVDGDTVEFFGTSQTVPTNLSPAFALKVTGDSVLFAGSTTWRGMLVTGNGLADIGGATVAVDSTFRTTGNGRLRMTNPAGKLSVRGEARFEGGSTTGRMTAGTLDLGGHFSQAGVTSPSSFAPSGTHLTQFRNFDLQPGNPNVVLVTISVSNTFASFFRNLLIDQEISATMPFRTIVTGSLTKPEFATLTGTVLEVGGDLTAGGALNGIIDFDTVHVAGVFTPNLSSQDYRITVLVMTGAAQTLPSFPHYATVVVEGDSVVIAGGAWMGSLFIDGTGLADVGGAVQVFGSLETRGQGRLRMAGGSLFVGGDATFGGGGTAGRLTGGTLTVGGGFTQSASNSAAAFAASAGHVTEFINTDFRAVTFATPDSLASHFGTLSLAGAGERRLESSVHVVGQLRTPPVAGGVVRKLSGLPLQGRQLVARGVDVDSLDLEALRLVVADGVPIGRFRDVRFVNQDPGVDRLVARRAGGSYTFARVTFTTAPDPGFAYVSVIDADGTAATPFNLTMDQPSPADPGPFTRTDGIATLTWAAGALLSGTVRNAVGGVEISGATVDLKQGANAAQSDATLLSTLTDAAGGYSFSGLAAGDYTLWVTASGFIDGAVTGITVTSSGPTGVDVALSPLQQAGETRIVVSWGATPTDLDSWLAVPDTVGGPPTYVAYGSPGASASYPFSQLDNDVTNGYGPETITIYQQLAGTYRFRVHDYPAGDNAASTTLLASEARVDVYQNNELVQTFTVPNAPGTLWTVFDLNGSTITPINTMSGDSPGSPVPGAATQLAFTVQPANAGAGATIAPPVQVSALDAFGSLATGFTGVVTVALYNGTGLTGTTSVAAVGGVATFGDLTIDQAATGYVLEASVAGGAIAAAYSDLFDVTAPAQIGGFVRTAVDTARIAGASVQLKQGGSATTGDPVYQSTLTDVNGGYYFPVPEGQYTLFFGAAGHITTRVASVTATAGQTTTVSAGLTPPLPVGRTRIVLSWGGAPPELDSHLLGPDGAGEFQVYYGAPGDSVASPFALLHQDIGNGQGPEAVTIYTQQAGVYEFRVHDWVGGADPADSVLRASGARVDVYQGTQQVASLTVPNQLGTLWKVFQLNGATITAVNTIVGDPPGTPIGGGAAAPVAAGLRASAPPRIRQGSR